MFIPMWLDPIIIQHAGFPLRFAEWAKESGRETEREREDETEERTL